MTHNVTLKKIAERGTAYEVFVDGGSRGVVERYTSGTWVSFVNGQSLGWRGYHGTRRAAVQRIVERTTMKEESK